MLWQIGALNEEIRRYVDPPEFLGFKGSHGLIGTAEMREDFGKCVSQIHAVPVIGNWFHRLWPLYVLEVDVRPSASICKNKVYVYGEAGEVKSYMRKGSSNFKQPGDETGKKEFYSQVQKNADTRRDAELNERKKCLEEEAEQIRRDPALSTSFDIEKTQRFLADKIAEVGEFIVILIPLYRRC